MNLKKFLFVSIAFFLPILIQGNNNILEQTFIKTFEQIQQKGCADITPLHVAIISAGTQRQLEELENIKNFLSTYQKKLIIKKNTQGSSYFSLVNPFIYIQQGNYISIGGLLCRVFTFAFEKYVFSLNHYILKKPDPQFVENFIPNGLLFTLNQLIVSTLISGIMYPLTRNYQHKIETQERINKTLEVIDNLLTDIEIMIATAQ